MPAQLQIFLQQRNGHLHDIPEGQNTAAAFGGVNLLLILVQQRVQAAVQLTVLKEHQNRAQLLNGILPLADPILGLYQQRVGGLTAPLGNFGLTDIRQPLPLMCFGRRRRRGDLLQSGHNLLHTGFVGQLLSEKPVLHRLHLFRQAAGLLLHILELPFQHRLEIVFHRQMKLPRGQGYQQAIQHRPGSEILHNPCQCRMIRVTEKERQGALLDHQPGAVFVLAKITCNTEPDTASPDDLGTEAVEGRDVGRIEISDRLFEKPLPLRVILISCPLNELPVNPFVHLGGGLAGKGEGENSVHRRPSAGHQVHKALGQDGGFSRASPGGHHRVCISIHRFLLIGIQLRHCEPPAGVPRIFSGTPL